jgi:hypothetical protein
LEDPKEKLNNLRFALTTIGGNVAKDDLRQKIIDNIPLSRKGIEYLDGMPLPATLNCADTTKITAFINELKTKVTDKPEARVPISTEVVKVQYKEWLNQIANALYGGGRPYDPAYDDYGRLKPNQQRYVMEVLEANIYEVVGQDPQIQKNIGEYETRLQDAQNAVTRVQADVDSLIISKGDAERLRNQARDEYLEVTKTAGEYDVQISNTEAEYAKKDKELDDEMAKLRLEDQAIRDRATSQGRPLTNAEKKRRGEILAQIKALNTQKMALPQQKQKAIEELKAYKKFAHENDLTDLRAISTATLSPVEQSVLTRKIQAIDAYEKSQQKYEKIEDDLRVKGEELKAAKQHLKKVEKKGVESINITFNSLFDGSGIQVDILTRNRTASRTDDLFSNVEYENRTLFGIPLNWLMGDAEFTAMKVSVQQWYDRQLARDPLYNKHLESGQNTESIASYQRFLKQVAHNEVFRRSMMQSPDGGGGENESVLHISTHEARTMDQYLDERTRLITYAQFLENWESLPVTQRP